MEAVRVLHDEVTSANEAGPRPQLIPVLGLNLVHAQRQVSVAADLMCDQAGHQLFVRGSKAELRSLAVCHPEHQVAIVGPSAGPFPQLARQQRRHQYFLTAGGGHFLAHDLLDLAENTKPERKVGVDAGSDLPDVPATNEQLVIGCLSLGGIVAKCPGEHAGKVIHGKRPPSLESSRQLAASRHTRERRRVSPSRVARPGRV